MLEESKERRIFLHKCSICGVVMLYNNNNRIIIILINKILIITYCKTIL